MAEMKTTGRRLAAHVRSLYAQQRAPVALVLVAVITVASVLSYLPLQIAAAVALLGMILQVLFDIDEKVAESKVNIWRVMQNPVSSRSAILEAAGQRVAARSREGVSHKALGIRATMQLYLI